MKNTKISVFGLVGLLLAIGLASLILTKAQRANASFDQSNLISDGVFIDTGKMDTAAIQRFLERKGSFLQGISEGGRSAAQIIYDAAHGRNDAAGSINGITINESTGTVNPAVILTTLQKEQGLITMASRDDGALQRAMGYACPDSGGCNSSYATFTKQVESGAWQLRYNYERASGHGFSDYQVGQSFNFDGNGGIFSNRATASLYRYTPHVYNGNYNFYNFFVANFSVDEYSYRFINETNPYTTLAQGASAQYSVAVLNTGTATWQKGTVNLGTDRGQDRIPEFTREGNGSSGWLAPQRVYLQEDSVAPGGTGHFTFWMKNDNVSPGTHREYFRL
ncbi:MAG: hypothetical protein NTZ65_00470, partial [Candidatus Berkelbacteria bacterium]|nr:hypothetical protein [Candidatus Berkelbacteria bacterium]